MSSKLKMARGGDSPHSLVPFLKVLVLASSNVNGVGLTWRKNSGRDRIIAAHWCVLYVVALFLWRAICSCILPTSEKDDGEDEAEECKCETSDRLQIEVVERRRWNRLVTIFDTACNAMIRSNWMLFCWRLKIGAWIVGAASDFLSQWKHTLFIASCWHEAVITSICVLIWVHFTV